MTKRSSRFLPAAAAVAALALASPFVINEFRTDTSPTALTAGDLSKALFTSGTAEAAIPVRDGVPTLAPVIEKVTPAVVNISVKGKTEAAELDENNPLFQNPELRRFFQQPGSPFKPQPRQRMSSGSGVIIDAKKGYVVTNHHVVDGAAEITVTLKDKREITAKLIGSDEGTDIALLQIEADNLSDLPIGDSSALKVGDYVIAVGNPFGLSQTVTSGIVSALGRSGLNIEGYEDFIQTDASINPGNSGGALVNLKGELIGINTAIIGPSGGNVGIGFAVPTSMAKSVMAQLASTGSVSRGRIGVQIQNMSPELAKNLGIDQSSGALVGGVEKGTPADAAGIKAGDVITAINGVPVQGASDLRVRVGMTPVGTALELTVIRGSDTKTVKVTIGKAAEAQKIALEESKPAIKGATFSENSDGVTVTEVEQGSPAWQAGLRPKDIVVGVNRKPVKSVDQLSKELKDSNRQTALFLKRGGEDMLVVIQ
ncbi:MAG: DegQ family serine endoprotease [Rhodospirillaceae bacterium]|nr:DegQ family serine endoprotease [Rhodospirillaceae bacterium]